MPHAITILAQGFEETEAVTAHLRRTLRRQW
jgi:hypothetical protein